MTVDLDQFRSLILPGDAECLAIYEEFCIQAEQGLIRIAARSESGDPDVAVLCHKLKGSCATLGFEELRAALQEREDRACQPLLGESSAAWLDGMQAKLRSARALVAAETGIEI